MATLAAALRAPAAADPMRDALSVKSMGLALDVLLADVDEAPKRGGDDGRGGDR